MLTMMVGVTHGHLEMLMMSVMMMRRVSTFGGPVRVCSTKPEGTLLHGFFDLFGAMLEGRDAPILVHAETPCSAVFEIPGDHFVSDLEMVLAGLVDGDGPIQLEIDDVGGGVEPRRYRLVPVNRLDRATLVGTEAETNDLDAGDGCQSKTSTALRASQVEGGDPILDG